MVPVLAELAWGVDVIQPAMGSQVAVSVWRFGCLELGACDCSLVEMWVGSLPVSYLPFPLVGVLLWSTLQVVDVPG